MTPKRTKMAEEVPPQVHRVSAKLPPFWKANPIVWFIQVEAQFEISGITQDSTKYNTIIANIDSSILHEIADLVIAPPEQNKYNAIKARLLNCFADSEEKKLKTLLQDIELGDKKPTSLLKEMRMLAGTRVSEAVVKSLWLNRLPTSIQPVLTVLDVDLNKLAEAADKLIDTVSCNQIAAVSNDQKSSLNELEELKAQIDVLSKKLNDQNQRRNRSRSRSKPKFRSFNSSNGDKCYYHAKFGDRAYRCSGPPCQMANDS